MTEPAIEVAREAVRAARQLLAGVRPATITGKTNPRDLVTEWDVRVEQRIREVLAARTPDVPVLGEEEGGASVTGTRWLVDPIDGTVNFAHGLPIWSISIAFEDEGELAAGVVCAPMLGWWFEATKGGGARDGTGAPLRVSAIQDLGQALLGTGFPYDRATNPLNNFAEWEALQRRAGACRRLGSASLDLCLVGCGWLDGYWERHVKPWDVAAGVLIVREAGGTVTNLSGGPFDLHEAQVVATNGAIHGELVAELARARP